MFPLGYYLESAVSLGCFEISLPALGLKQSLEFFQETTTLRKLWGKCYVYSNI